MYSRQLLSFSECEGEMQINFSDPTEISKWSRMSIFVLIVEGRLSSDSGGRLREAQMLMAVESGNDLVKIVMSDDVEVTIVGCKSSISVEYCKVESFRNKLSTVDSSSNSGK